MMNMKVFGSICILAFVLLATVSAQNETTTAVAAATTTTTSVAAAATTAAAAAATTAIVPTTTTTTSSPASTAAATVPPTSTAVPPTTQTPDLTTKTSRIDTEARITSVKYDEVKDLTSVAGKAFKTDFEGKMLGVMKQKNKLVIDVKVTNVRNGSVIVEYYLVLNTTSEAEAAKIADAVTEAIKSGKIGNYTTDPAFKPDAYIIRKVKASDVSPASDPTATTVSTALLIILGVALFILLVIIIILIVLVVFLLKLKEKREK